MTGESVLAAEGYPLTLRTGDLCRILGIHINTLYKRIEMGQVPAYTKSIHGKRSHYEWYRPDVERWLTTRRLVGMRRTG